MSEAESSNTKYHVGGTVIRHDETSAICEINIGGKVLEAQLPRHLFPEELRYGLPVNIEMLVAGGGLRNPVITTRELDKNNEKLEEEFNLILNEIERCDLV